MHTKYTNTNAQMYNFIFHVFNDLTEPEVRKHVPSIAFLKI